MNTAPVRSADIRRARLTFVTVGLVLPVVIAAIAVAVILAWIPELPDRVATHWSHGGPDGFGSPQMYVWMQAGLGIGLPLLIAIPPLLMMQQAWGLAGRLLGALSLGVSGLVAVANAGSVAIQRGAADAADVGDIGPVVGLAFGALVVLTALGWFVQPRVNMPAVMSADQSGSDRVRLAPGERAAWFGFAAMARPGVVVLVLAVLVLVAVSALLLILGEPSGWITAAVAVVVGALAATTLVFRVSVGRSGLRVRSLIGWPRIEIPLDEIQTAGAVQVNPMAEFGGWGMRVGLDGRTGVVLRTGEGLQVVRTDGRVFVVTVDGAQTAASVLAAAQDQHLPEGESR